MPVGGHILIEATTSLLRQLAELEGFDDGPGAQIKMVLHEGGEVGVADHTRAEALHQNADRARHTDGVAELHLRFAGQACRHKGLGHVAGGIGSGAVHLGGVLAGEGATAVAGVSPVGVHDDLAACQARVSLGAAHHKLASGVHQETGVCLAGLEGQIGGSRLDHVAPEVGGDALPQGLLLTD